MGNFPNARRDNSFAKKNDTIKGDGDHGKQQWERVEKAFNQKGQKRQSQSLHILAVGRLIFAQLSKMESGPWHGDPGDQMQGGK